MIVVAGESLIDLVVEPDGSLTAALGGAPFNTARTCGRLGVDVAFMGAISVDRFGSMLAAQLDADHVRADLVDRVSAPTTLAVAELDDRGAASYRFYLEQTSAPTLDEVPDVTPSVLFTGGLGLVLEPLADTIEALVHRLADATSTVMVDVNCRPLVIVDRDAYVGRLGRVLRHAHIVKVSDEDLAFLSPDASVIEAARSLLDAGPKAVLLTAGGDSVTVLTAEGESVVPVVPVDVVDTIGAGDAFGGGFLAWWVAEGLGRDDLSSLRTVVPAVTAAIEVAGVVCGRRGADPPWRHELAADWSH